MHKRLLVSLSRSLALYRAPIVPPPPKISARPNARRTITHYSIIEKGDEIINPASQRPLDSLDLCVKIPHRPSLLSELVVVLVS